MFNNKYSNFPKIFSRIFLHILCKEDYPPFLPVKMSYIGGDTGEGGGSPPYTPTQRGGMSYYLVF